MILVDTSVWVDHLRKNESHLAGLLGDGEVVVHPFVIGELACGNLKNREEILSLLKSLPSSQAVEDSEVLFFIAEHKLHGRGLGLVDMHLLASSRLGRHLLLTKDKRLMTAATDLGIGYAP